MRSLEKLSAMALTLCCLCLACSPAVLTGSWRDPEYRGGPIKKVLVVGLSSSDLIQRMLEDEFVSQLGASGVQATASYSLFTPQQLKEEREQVEAKVKSLGYQQVIVNRLVSKRTEEVVQPGMVYGGGYPRGYYRGGWGGYYHESWGAVYQPPTSYQVDIATIESKLFTVDTSKMIWSGQLETEIGGTAASANTRSIIESYVKVVLKDLGKEGLL